MAPEYMYRRKLTEKVDVYSFGVLLLEIVSGRGVADPTFASEQSSLLEWAWQMQEEGRREAMADGELEGAYEAEEVERVVKVALLCTQAAAAGRPKMSEALGMLAGNRRITFDISRPGFLRSTAIGNRNEKVDDAGHIRKKEQPSSSSSAAAALLLSSSHAFLPELPSDAFVEESALYPR